MQSGVLVGGVVMGQSRCRRGGNMGMSGNGNTGRQTEGSIQWGDNQFHFLEVPEKNAYFYFF
jgi:hypothetical protein